MPGYIILTKYTQQALANIKQAPERSKRVYAVAEKAGIKLVGLWWTMGQYDAVMIYDAPDDQTMAAFILSALQSGNYTGGQTLRAFSEDEFAQIVAKLP